MGTAASEKAIRRGIVDGIRVDTAVSPCYGHLSRDKSNNFGFLAQFE